MKVAAVIAVVLVACRASPPLPSDPAPPTEPATPAAPQIPRFTREPPLEDELDTPYHKLRMRATLDDNGSAIPFVELLLLPRGTSTRDAKLGATIELRDPSGKPRPAPLERTERMNYAGSFDELRATDGVYLIDRMQPSVQELVRLTFTRPLAPPADLAVRVVIDGQTIDLALPFGPPTDAELREATPQAVSPDVERECTRLAACCASSPSAEHRQACTGIVEAARRLEVASQCREAAAAYCPQ